MKKLLKLVSTSTPTPESILSLFFTFASLSVRPIFVRTLCKFVGKADLCCRKFRQAVYVSSLASVIFQVKPELLDLFYSANKPKKSSCMFSYPLVEMRSI